MVVRHPAVELVQVTSDSLAGRPLARAHPNLRKATTLTFTPHADLRPADATFVATPHGESMARMPSLLETNRFVIDLSADFRLKDPAAYAEYYPSAHRRPELLPESVYGLPELHRSEIAGARLVAVPGCIATASILALKPLVDRGLVAARPVVVDAKSGSSASGQDAGPAGRHAERSGVMRAYAPAGHRHTAEIEQETGARVALSCHAVEAVRGVLAPRRPGTDPAGGGQERRRGDRGAYRDEPFVRIVHESDGIHREPEPKILAGTNFCDVGFATDPHAGRVVALAALDNLMKGAAGNAVQCFNLRAGIPETTGLEFLGLHPV